MSSVTFPVDVGGDGSTFTDDDNPTTGLANYGYVTRLVPMLGQSVAVAEFTVEQAEAAAASAASALNAPGTNATSTTSLAIGTGTKAFTIQTGKAFSIGQVMVAASAADPSNQMTGIVTAHNSGTGALTLDVSDTNGSGTYADWTLSLSALVSSTLPSQTGNSGKFLTTNGTSASWAAVLIPGNNLSDLSNAGTARDNLGLGDLAVLDTVNNSQWSGTDLAVANGGTGASTAGDARNNLGAAASGANSDITSLTALSTPLSIAQGGTGGGSASVARNNLGLGSLAVLSTINNANWSGTDLDVANGGTGASNATDARTNLSAAKSGANTDITSLGGLTTALSTTQGGTGSNFADLAALLAGLPITGGLTGEFRLGTFYVKWGQALVTPATSGTTGEATVTFANAFPTACAGIIHCPLFDSGGAKASTNYGAYVRDVSASGAKLGLDSSGTPNDQSTCYWIAWGY
ncbi:MAG: hypothetical protein ACK4RV_10165 [Caulobacter sp.]